MKPCKSCGINPRLQWNKRVFSYCRECTNRLQRRYREKRVAERIAAGLCVDCGKPKRDATQSCLSCTSRKHPKQRSTRNIGMVLNGREIIDMGTKIEYPENGHNKGNGKIAVRRYRREYLLRCLTCQDEKWTRLPSKLEKSPMCIHCFARLGSPNGERPPLRKNFCSTCGSWMRRGKGPSEQCKKCYVPPKWTIETWISAGRPYIICGSQGGVKKTRKDAVRLFLYAEQNGCCKLCKQLIDLSGSHIDHNHTTDQVRGLVHASCNLLIGAIEARGFPAPIHALVQGLFEYPF